jgi:hypothetical protein
MLHSKIQESDQIRLSLTANAATQQRITQRKIYKTEIFFLFIIKPSLIFFFKIYLVTSELDQQRALYRIKCDEVDKLRFQYTKELE